MTVNYRIVWDNAVDTATLGASPALVATLPETNLQQQGRATVARTTSTATQTITGNFAASKLLSSMVLWRHNLSPEATVRLELFQSANQTGETRYDSGALPPYTAKSLGDLVWGVDPLGVNVFSEWGIYWTVFWFDPINAASFRLTLSDAGNAAGYLQASRLFIGPTLTGHYNVSYGATAGWEESTQQIRTAGGSILSTGGLPTRVLNFDLDWLQPSDRPKIMEMRRRVGLRQDFFVSLYPEAGGSLERDHAMIGKFASNDLIGAPKYNVFETQLRIRET